MRQETKQVGLHRTVARLISMMAPTSYLTLSKYFIRLTFELFTKTLSLPNSESTFPQPRISRNIGMNHICLIRHSQPFQRFEVQSYTLNKVPRLRIKVVLSNLYSNLLTARKANLDYFTRGFDFIHGSCTLFSQLSIHPVCYIPICSMLRPYD